MNKSIFRNESTCRVPVLDYGKRMLFTLGPGEERFLPDGNLMDNPFERFEEIVFLQGGAARVRESGGWEPPRGWCTEFLNLGPHQTESMKVDDEYSVFFRSIPRTLLMPYSDANIFFEKITWLPSTQVTRHWDDPGRFYEFQTSKVEKTLRPQFHVELIKAEIAAEATKKSEGISDRRLKEVLEEVKC